MATDRQIPCLYYVCAYTDYRGMNKKEFDYIRVDHIPSLR